MSTLPKQKGQPSCHQARCQAGFFVVQTKDLHFKDLLLADSAPQLVDFAYARNNHQPEGKLQSRFSFGTTSDEIVRDIRDNLPTGKR